MAASAPAHGLLLAAVVVCALSLSDAHDAGQALYERYRRASKALHGGSDAELELAEALFMRNLAEVADTEQRVLDTPALLAVRAASLHRARVRRAPSIWRRAGRIGPP